MIRNAHFLIISPGLPYHYNRAFSNIRSLKYRRKKHGYKFFYSDVSNTAHKLHHLLPPKGIQRYNLSPASTRLCCQKFALVVSRTYLFHPCPFSRTFRHYNHFILHEVIILWMYIHFSHISLSLPFPPPWVLNWPNAWSSAVVSSYCLLFAWITFRLMLFFSEFSESSNAFPLEIFRDLSKNTVENLPQDVFSNQTNLDKESGSHPKHVRVAKIFSISVLTLSLPRSHQ